MRHQRPQSPDDLRAELVQAADQWAADDPDPQTRAQLEHLVARVNDGDEGAAAALHDCFAGLLEFGTAGLRGPLGPGPNRMNRAVVIRTAAGLTAYLARRTPEPTVVVGYDARHGSSDFAVDTAAVVTAAGGRALLFPTPLPTPVLAFAIRRLRADAGVMVTASHNPPQDNGYKVYLGDGAQIVPPTDVEISAAISAVRSTAQVRRAESGWTVLDDSVVDDYLQAITQVLGPDTPRDVRIVHTALHGVGHDVVTRAFTRAGFADLVSVAEQAAPDPDFPTVSFPNPEEPGAIDLALALARRLDAEATAGIEGARRADVLIANDPDADRCAVAVPDPSVATEDDPRGWRLLRGDELGWLLGHHLIERGACAGGVLARSVVSSRLLDRMAQAAGVPCVQTLTGFKWIARTPNLAYGYEEALGYCCAPAVVRDKDGISAALLIAEYVASLAVAGRRLTDVLDDLALQHGVHATDAFAVRVDDVSRREEVLARLRAERPQEIGGVPVERYDDLGDGVDGLPPTDGLRFLLTDGTQVILRPSGTEPKLKVYLEAVVPVPDGECDRDARLGALAGARGEARGRLARAVEVFRALTRLE